MKTILKKRLFLVFASFFQVIHAENQFYGSIGAGVDALSGKRSDIITDTGDNTKHSLSQQTGVKSKSPVVSTNVGYLYKFSKCAVGAEGLFGYSQLKDSVSGVFEGVAAFINSYKVTQELSTQLGFFAKAGYYPSEDWFLYTIAGVMFQKSRLTLDASGGNAGPGTIWKFSINKWKKGPAFGLGFSKVINKHYEWGIEGRITFFARNKGVWENYDRGHNFDNIRSTFKNTLYSVRMRFTYNF